jgi:hypothetical protein
MYWNTNGTSLISNRAVEIICGRVDKVKEQEKSIQKACLYAGMDRTQFFDGFDHMYWNTNGTSLISNRARNCLTNPPSCIS